jgi:hypothetical protein
MNTGRAAHAATFRKFALWMILLVLATSLACSTPSLSSVVTGTEVSFGPCDNVLYPFFIGAHWVYQVDRQNGSDPTRFALTVTKVADSQATVEALSLSTGVTTQVIADCDQGAIRNFPLLSQDMLFGDLVTSDFSMTYVSGVFAPAQEVFLANDWNYNWTADYLLNGTVEAKIEGETIPITLKDTPLHMVWQTAGVGDAAFEAVTVPAGTFERALKVTNTASTDITFDLAGLPVTGSLTLHTTQWFEPFTGMLKSQIDSGEVTALGISFPVELKGSVELVEYMTAH